MRIIQTALIFLCISCIALTASASTSDRFQTLYRTHREDIQDTGYYLDLLAGGGYEKAQGAYNNGYAAVINWGYQFTPKWGTEIGVNYLPNVRTPLSNATHNFFVYDAALKSVLNIERWSLFGKLGIALQTGKLSTDSGASFQSKSELALYTDGGFAYNLTRQMSLEADLASSYGRSWDTFTYTTGIHYYF